VCSLNRHSCCLYSLDGHTFLDCKTAGSTIIVTWETSLMGIAHSSGSLLTVLSRWLLKPNLILAKPWRPSCRWWWL
jgi:hypothetical protein